MPGPVQNAGGAVTSFLQPALPPRAGPVLGASPSHLLASSPGPRGAEINLFEDEEPKRPTERRQLPQCPRLGLDRRAPFPAKVTPGERRGRGGERKATLDDWSRLQQMDWAVGGQKVRGNGRRIHSPAGGTPRPRGAARLAGTWGAAAAGFARTPSLAPGEKQGHSCPDTATCKRRPREPPRRALPASGAARAGAEGPSRGAGCGALCGVSPSRALPGEDGQLRCAQVRGAAFLRAPRVRELRRRLPLARAPLPAAAREAWPPSDLPADQQPRSERQVERPAGEKAVGGCLAHLAPRALAPRALAPAQEQRRRGAECGGSPASASRSAEAAGAQRALPSRGPGCGRTFQMLEPRDAAAVHAGGVLPAAPRGWRAAGVEVRVSGEAAKRSQVWALPPGLPASGVEDTLTAVVSGGGSQSHRNPSGPRPGPLGGAWGHG